MSALPGSSLDHVASPPAVNVPDTVPMSQMDLDDVLDSSFLQPSTASRSNSSEGEGCGDDDGEAAEQSPSDSVVAPQGGRSFDDLSRWSRIPIGAYRRSTANNALINDRAFPPALRGIANAEGSFYLPVGTTRYRGGGGKKSSSNLGSIPVSPVLFPSRSTSHGQHSSGLVPINSKAKKAKRKQKKTPSKAKPKAKSTALPKGRITPRALAALQVDHPPSGVSFPPPPPQSDDFFYANPHLPDLPAPSLPSAGCPPFGSPLFSGVGQSESIPSFSFDG
jgi:hypothetical protein